MPYTNEQQQWLFDIQREKLQRLEPKYSAAPNYGVMSLSEELQARFDMDEINQLRQNRQKNACAGCENML